ncbi:hypothetical protein CFIICLFH_1561 [Methylobacterium goesingense]|nr:hypothetical protein CFIICLFH_1561 [Methylobacterium goesingense]
MFTLDRQRTRSYNTVSLSLNDHQDALNFAHNCIEAPVDIFSGRRGGLAEYYSRGDFDIVLRYRLARSEEYQLLLGVIPEWSEGGKSRMGTGANECAANHGKTLHIKRTVNQSAMTFDIPHFIEGVEKIIPTYVGPERHRQFNDFRVSLRFGPNLSPSVLFIAPEREFQKVWPLWLAAKQDSGARVDRMVETGSKGVDGFVEQHTEIAYRSANNAGLMDIVSSIFIVLKDDFIGVGIREGSRVDADLLDVLIRPNEQPTGTVERLFDGDHKVP